MKTMTLSFRMESAEVKLLDEAAAQDGLDRASLIKHLLRRGYADYRYEAACAAYRRGEVTLSRAAEMAGISQYEMVARLPEAGMHLNLTAEDLCRELSV